MFKIGQKVSFIDNNTVGVIRAIKGEIITIETSDGFTLEASPGELILDQKMDDVFLDAESIENVKKTDLSSKKSKLSVKKKERYIPPMEVDLHIHHLVKNQKGMSNYDMLNIQVETARQKLEFAIHKRIQRIVFIHGVGEGVLKTELEYLFGRYGQVKFYDADYQKYGLGATEVYIFQNISD